MKQPNDMAAPEPDALRALREELAGLAARVAALEAELAAVRAAPAAAGAEEPEVDEALLAVLSAAVAAYLGKKPRIRSVRVLSSPEWARSGRMHIQGSHRR